MAQYPSFHYNNWMPTGPGLAPVAQLPQHYTYDCVHSPEQAPQPIQAPLTFGTQPNRGPPIPIPIPNGPPHQGRDFDDDFDTPTYRGHLALTVTVPFRSRIYIVTPIPLLETDGRGHTSFKVCFKRRWDLLSTRDVERAWRYIRHFRHYLLDIIRTACTCLERIWIVDAELTAGLLPVDNGPLKAHHFLQNRTGLYMKCLCGSYVYIGECIEAVAQWRNCWNIHLTFFHDMPQ